jgi:hypothetical protein
MISGDSPENLHPEEGPMAKKAARRARTKVQLVASNEGRPSVRLTPGKRYEVVVTSVVDPGGVARKPVKRPARLCGSRGTCVAIVETD